MASISLHKESQSCISGNPKFLLVYNCRPCKLCSIFSAALRKLSENRFPIWTQICTPWCFYVFSFKKLKSIDFFPHCFGFLQHTCTRTAKSSQRLAHMLCLLHEFREPSVYFPAFPTARGLHTILYSDWHCGMSTVKNPGKRFLPSHCGKQKALSACVWNIDSTVR